MRILLVSGILALTCLVWGAYFFLSPRAEQVFPHTTADSITIGGVPLYVTVVKTPESRSRGLSGREPLAPNEGMLFVFPDEGLHGFWMKDMRFSIDILWVSSRGKVVHIASNVAPESYPKVFSPREPATYVLEVPAGYGAAHGIEIGSEISVESAL